MDGMVAALEGGEGLSENVQEFMSLGGGEGGKEGGNGRFWEEKHCDGAVWKIWHH